MNSLLKEWGLKINTKQKVAKINIDNKRKSIKIIIYFLDYYIDFNNFI